MAGSSGGASCRPRIHMKSRVFSELMEIQEDRSDRNGPSKFEARMHFLGTSGGKKRRAQSPVPHEPTDAPQPKRHCSVLDRLGQSRSRVARALRPSSPDPSEESPSLQGWDPVDEDSPPPLSATLRSRLGGPARVKGAGTAASGRARGPAPGERAVAAAPSGRQASRPAAAAAAMPGLRPAVTQGKLRGSGQGTDLRQQLSAQAAAAADRGSIQKARQRVAAAAEVEQEESGNEDDSSLEAERPGARLEHRLRSWALVELQARQQASGEGDSPTRSHSLGPETLSDRLRHRLGAQGAAALRHQQAAGRDSSPRHRAAGRDAAGRDPSPRRQSARRDLSPRGRDLSARRRAAGRGASPRGQAAGRDLSPRGRDPSPRRRADRSPVYGDQGGQRRHQQAAGTNPSPRRRADRSPSLDGEDSPRQPAASGDGLDQRAGHGVLQRLGRRGAAAQGHTVRAGGRHAADRHRGRHAAEAERLHRAKDRHAAEGQGGRHAAEEDRLHRAKHRHAADGARQARDEQRHAAEGHHCRGAHRGPSAAAAGRAAEARDLGLQAESSLVEALRQPRAGKPAAPSGTASAAMSGPSSTVVSERVASADVELPEVTSHFMRRVATARQQAVGSGRGRPDGSVVSAATLHRRTSAARQTGRNNDCSDDLDGLVQGMYADRVSGPKSLAHRLGLPVRI